MRFPELDFFESVEAVQSAPSRAGSGGGAVARTAATPAKPAGGSKPTTTAKPAPATKPGATAKPAPNKPATTPSQGAKTTPAKPASDTSKKSGFGFDQIGGLITKGIGAATTGAQIAGQIQQWTSPQGGTQAATATPPSPTDPGPAPPFPYTGAEPVPTSGPEPTATGAVGAGSAISAAPAQTSPPAPQAAQTIGGDQLGALIQALQQRQIPPLPGSPMSSPVTTPVAPADGLSLLRVLLTNPQLAGALWAPQPQAMPRSIALPMPAAFPYHRRATHIPLAAVMNAIATLAGQSMTELNEAIAEDAEEVPSYLIGEDGQFLVDPANATDRAALVTHLFRMSNAAQRPRAQARVRRPAVRDRIVRDLDDADAFARDAGFGM